MLTKIQTLVLIALVFSILPTTSAAREMLRGDGEPDASATAARPGDLPPDSRLEELIRQVYGTYESTVVKSGHDLEFRLRDFQTILRREFDEHEWLGLMTPPTGMRIVQTRTYYDADWLRAGEVVYYDLRWQAASEQTENVVTETKEFLAGTSISRTLQLQQTLWDRILRPLAITSFTVEVRFQGRDRTYRAAAFWEKSDEQVDQFLMNLEDRIVPDVQSAVLDDATPVTQEELRALDLLPPRQENRLRSPAGESSVGSCQADVNTIRHTALQLPDRQGHSKGGHLSQLRMEATCEYSADCHVQCKPSITLRHCDEANLDGNGIELPTFCEHEGHFDARISGAGASGAVSCGSAIACGIKECCGFRCGDVGFSFSGTGGDFTASVSNTGSGKTYNLSIDDSIECAAPLNPDPCAGATSVASGSRVAAASCVDGPEGGTDSPPGDGTQCTDPSCWESPVLIDLGGANIVLTSLRGGVLFDIEPGGAIEQVAWTVPQSADGFLALDRNGNGIIDDGSELFGNNTPQPPSADPNGFRALAVFDRPDQGGDSDGWLTERDAVFSQLRLWRDADHDGLSEDDELFPLSVAGIKAIELSYVESRRRDRHGNQFRYKSRVRLRRSTTQAVDVFLLTQ